MAAHDSFASSRPLGVPARSRHSDAFRLILSRRMQHGEQLFVHA